MFIWLLSVENPKRFLITDMNSFVNTASMYGHLDAVKWLLSEENPHRVFITGLDWAIFCAKNKSHQEIVDVLESYKKEKLENNSDS